MLPNPDDLTSDKAYETRARDEYNEKRCGPLTVLPCSICYVPLTHFVPEPALLEMRATAQRCSAFGADKTAVVISRFRDEANLGHIEYIFDLGNWSSYFPGEEGKKYGTMLQILQYPFSVGSIHIRHRNNTLRDENSEMGLEIDPKYYKGENGELDIEVMEVAARFLQRIVTTKPLADIIRCPAAPSTEQLKTSEQLRDWIVNNTVTDWHPVGTCAMGGHAGVEGGVVNERLQVYGVENLRVVDASIMPLQISAHLQATVYAIAEKAADMILEDLGDNEGAAEQWPLKANTTERHGKEEVKDT